MYKLTCFLIATAFAISTSQMSALVLQEIRMKNFSGDLQTINELVIPSNARIWVLAYAVDVVAASKHLDPSRCSG